MNIRTLYKFAGESILRTIVTIAMVGALASCNMTNVKKQRGETDGQPSVAVQEPEAPADMDVPSSFSETRETITIDGVSFTMIRVEGGSFYMGAQSTDASGRNYDPEAEDEEDHVREETVNTFYIGETEVTQALWKAVMGKVDFETNPPQFEGGPERDYTGPQRPMCFVNTIYCQHFIDRLNKWTGCKFRLPTEAEWEFAARGGNHSKGYKYSGSNDIDEVAWYDGNTGGKGSRDVKTKAPNELGIYDMSGNVCEWVSDEWNEFYYTDTPMTLRTHRGGCWYDEKGKCRVSSRSGEDEEASFDVIGFRLALEIMPQ